MDEALHLTWREAQVLELLARGYHNREIAAVLFVSSETVNTHVDNILHKLHVKTRVEAAAWWARHGNDIETGKNPPGGGW